MYNGQNALYVIGIIIVIVTIWLSGLFFMIEKISDKYSNYVFPAYALATGFVLIAIGYFAGG